LSSKWPACRRRDRGVVADHLRGDLRHDLGMTGLTLPGMIERALLELGQEELREPGARAGAHQREVVRDLRQRDGDDLERARELDEPSRAACASNGSAGGEIVEAVSREQVARTARRTRRAC
jgi:hypothetical protein